MMHRLHTRGAAAHRARRPFSAGPRVVIRASSANGNGAHKPSKPSPAETARTIVDLVNEGTLSTIAASGIPIGYPVSYSLDKEGHAFVTLDAGAMELQNLAAEPRCSLQVQPIAQPARAVASVTLLGRIETGDSKGNQYRLAVEKCLYFGGLDQSTQRVQEVSGDDFRAAEPDVLRKTAAELVTLWNNERADDIYRIVSNFLDVSLSDMSYAELLWVDRLGMYIRSEVVGKQPEVVRVPFYRAVLDDRDARSVITMASQMAWEAERHYNPPLPAIFTETPQAAAASSN